MDSLFFVGDGFGAAWRLYRVYVCIQFTYTPLLLTTVCHVIITILFSLVKLYRTPSFSHEIKHLLQSIDAINLLKGLNSMKEHNTKHCEHQDVQRTTNFPIQTKELIARLTLSSWHHLDNYESLSQSIIACNRNASTKYKKSEWNFQ